MLQRVDSNRFGKLLISLNLEVDGNISNENVVSLEISVRKPDKAPRNQRSGEGIPQDQGNHHVVFFSILLNLRGVSDYGNSWAFWELRSAVNYLIHPFLSVIFPQASISLNGFPVIIILREAWFFAMTTIPWSSKISGRVTMMMVPKVGMMPKVGRRIPHVVRRRISHVMRRRLSEVMCREGIMGLLLRINR